MTGQHVLAGLSMARRADPGSGTDLDAGVAIYWDFENVHACVLDELRGEGTYRPGRFRPQEPVVDIDSVVEYAATVGRIVVHRAYGNWQYFGRYRDELQPRPRSGQSRPAAGRGSCSQAACARRDIAGQRRLRRRGGCTGPLVDGHAMHRRPERRIEQGRPAGTKSRERCG